MLKDITLGQYFPVESPVHRLDARTKLILSFAFIIVLFLAHGFWAYVLCAAGVIGVTLLSRIRFRMLLKSLKPIAFLAVFTALLNMLYTPGQILWEFWIFHITKEGLVTAVYMVVRIMLLVASTSLLTYTTSPIVLTDGLERLMEPLNKLHVPVHEISMMMTIALRFIPTLIEETDKIMNAQKARGAQLDNGKMTERIKALVPVLVPLFISAFRRADELAMAMECRCYRGGDGRTRLKVLRCEKQDYIDLAVCIACFAVILASRLVFPNF